ncbi:ribonuclease E activity regulator RraA [Chitinimonas lacunae]|uniref:4-hydroxy-4-methyl-2-oxoglutarate aldolase n=1 Tax=Chitinimonas lacunae TaxID=1963018 RepID=A0ABV8MSI9_9NEIS
MNFQTADISDHHGERVQVAEPIFRAFGLRAQFAGPIHTLKVFEDNTLVRATLETPGHGRVLVIDGGGSLRCALVGGQLGQLAVSNGWAGIVVWGCIRDSVEIDGLDFGVRALATHPRKSLKKGEGSSGQIVRFAGVSFTPGHWLYADEDGLVVAPEPVH